MRRALVAIVLFAGCAPTPRFADRKILWIEHDDAPVAMPPEREAFESTRIWLGANNAVFRSAARVFTVDYGKEAVNVNAVDEVPDSTWYEDRRRDPEHPAAPLRALGADVIGRGAVDDDPPAPPYTVIRGLSGGSAGGFVVLDAKQRRYALKIDPKGHMGLVTGADAVATRLAWGSGWRVPADEIVDFTRADLIVDPKAKMLNRWGQKEPLEAGDVDAVLAHAAHDGAGRYRAVASRWVAGHILGSFSYLGRDPKDGNDLYPHEDRRDLRGFGVFAAWIDDVDVLENNTLDSYVGEPGHGHVVHYQLDVGGSFGQFAALQSPYWMGDQSYLQSWRILGSIATLGLLPHRYENAAWLRRRRALLDQYPEFGGYSADHFELRHWRPILDLPPLVRATARDRLWGAKRVAAFSREEVAAAVAAGHYRPAAAGYLEETLWRRREQIAREAFSESTAIDHFAVTRGSLCFTDLWVRAGLGGETSTAYRAREDGRDVGFLHGAAADGAACVALPARDGYRVIALAVARPGERRFEREVAVHLMARGAHGYVLGVVR
ncbi:MAG TPA: hypothetical protein VGL86_15805 [Polyangia bacterium]|jgi:hypothetical protein